MAMTAALVLTLLPTATYENENMQNAKAAEIVPLQNPRIVEDSSMKAGQKVTWDCVWFGSYPQAEVVTTEMSQNYTALDSSLLQDGDLFVSDSVYSALDGATGWNANNDIMLGGEKYRRMRKGDATNSDNYNDEKYYQWPDSTNWHYFKYEPIKWRVLETDGSQALLLSDVALDDQKYHQKNETVTWKTSTVRRWLNGYGAGSNQQGIDYSGKNFLDSAFSLAEQNAIRDSALENADNLEYGTEGGNDTTDKVFLLSESDVWSTDKAVLHGFVKYDAYDEARWSKSSTYAKAMGTSSSTDRDYAGNCDWWLRYPGDYDSYYAPIGYYNGWGRWGAYVYFDYDGVRAALNLNLSSFNLYTYAGTVCSDGTEDEQAAPESGGGETTVPEQEDELQCSTSCTVEAGKSDSINPIVLAKTKEGMEALTSKVTWTSSNESIVKVSSAGFLHPTQPTVYQTDSGEYSVWRAVGLVSVQGVSEGSATVTGRADNGVETVCRVTVTPKQEQGSGQGSGGGSLTLGENQTGKADDNKGVAQFFPDSWSLKQTIFPVELERKEEADGSYKVKLAIGIGKSDWLDDETKWNKFKKNVEDLQKGEKRYKELLEKYKKQWGLKPKVSVETSKFKALPELSVMGYYEQSCDKNGNVIESTGKIAVAAKWEGSVDWQFVTPIGPLYLNLKGGVKADGKIGPAYDFSTKTLKIVDGSLKLTPSVTLEGGYGISKVATIGAQGTLSLPITLIPATKGEFSAKAAVHVKLVFVIDWTHDLATYKTTLWDTTGGSKKILAKAGQTDSLSDGTLSEMDTSFVAYTSDWHGKGAKVLRVRALDAADISSLQEGVMESTLPMQAEADGKRVMVFQAYDSAKSTLSSSTLMYSVFEGGEWSEPKAVWDTEGSDLYADMKVVNGKIALAWQKEKAAVSGDVSVESEQVLGDIAANSEICFAIFDPETNTFTDQIYVTNNADCDMMPKVCEGSSDIAVSWVRNSAADLMQENGGNVIYAAKWNGSSFDGEKALVTAPGTVDQYVSYEEDGRLKAMFSGQQNGLSAVFDSDGQVSEAFSELLMVSEDGTVTSMDYADGAVDCMSGGTLYRYHLADGSVEKLLAGEGAFGGYAVRCSNGEKSGYVWSAYDEESDTGSIIASMETEEGYSEPVTLCEKKGTMWRYLSPLLDREGNWKIVANALNTESSLNALIYVEKQEETRVRLADASVDERDTSDGKTAVDYLVENVGDTTVEYLNLEVTPEDGQMISMRIPVTLLPGGCEAGTAYVDLSGIGHAQDVEIIMYADGQTDQSGCMVKSRAGLPDVEVTADSVEDKDKVVITANVSNNSSKEAETVLHLYADETKTKELYHSEKMAVKAGGAEQVEITVRKSNVTYNENNAAYLTLYAESAEGDYKEDNNTEYVILYKEQSGGETEPQETEPEETEPQETEPEQTEPQETEPGETEPQETEPQETEPQETEPEQTEPSGGEMKPDGEKTPTVGSSQGTTPGKEVPPARGAVLRDKTGNQYIVTIPGAKGKTGAVTYKAPASKKVKKVAIPATVTVGGITYKVTAIAAKAFFKCTVLKKVTIPASVTSIGKQAFYGCKKLRSIKIATTKLTKKNVGKQAFKGIHAKATVKVPKKKLKAYKKLLRAKGIGRKAKIKK